MVNRGLKVTLFQKVSESGEDNCEIIWGTGYQAESYEEIDETQTCGNIVCISEMSFGDEDDSCHHTQIRLNWFVPFERPITLSFPYSYNWGIWLCLAQLPFLKRHQSIEPVLHIPGLKVSTYVFTCWVQFEIGQFFTVMYMQATLS